MLVNADGSRLEMYDLKADRHETDNTAALYPEKAQAMAREVINWYSSKKGAREQ